MSIVMECSSMEDHGHHLANVAGRKRMTLRLGSQRVKRGKPPNGKHLSEFFTGYPPTPTRSLDRKQFQDPMGQDERPSGGSSFTEAHRRIKNGARQRKVTKGLGDDVWMVVSKPVFYLFSIRRARTDLPIYRNSPGPSDGARAAGCLPNRYRLTASHSTQAFDQTHT